MVSHFGHIPVVEAVAVFNKDKGGMKDRLLRNLQTSVKEVQDIASQLPCEKKLTNIDEVQRLCDCLERALRHGLRKFENGFWPCIQDFSHWNTIEYILSLKGITTNLGRSRAWLCFALNENNLESYFESFRKNSHILARHYLETALVCDEERIQVLTMLTAGLEYIPFNIDVNELPLDTIGFIWSGNSKEECSRDSLSLSSLELESQGSTISPTSLKSFQEGDSGITSLDGALEITDELSLKDVEEELEEIERRKSIASNSDICNCESCSLHGYCITKETARISRLMKMKLEDNSLDDVEDNTLEVIHTKTRRRKKANSLRVVSTATKLAESSSMSEYVDESDQNINEDGDDELEVSGELKPKNSLHPSNACGLPSDSSAVVGSESGQQVHLESSSDPLNPNGTNTTVGKCTLSSTPLKMEDSEELNERLSSSSPKLYDLGERGAPEGQEDPVKLACSFSDRFIDRLPLLKGSDGLEDEEEMSIYDLNKSSEASTPTSEEQAVQSADDEDSGQRPNLNISQDSPVEVKGSEEEILTCNGKPIDIVTHELNNLPLNTGLELHLKPSNNTILCLMLTVFETEDEQFYRLYHAFVGYTEDQLEHILFLISTKYLYTLKVGDGDRKFITKMSVPFKDIDYIHVTLNYQQFWIVCTDHQRKLCISTGDEYLTGSIISSLELAIRRSQPVENLPSVITDISLQEGQMKKSLATEMKCEPSSVDLNHYVLVRWEDHMGTNGNTSVSAAGPMKEGYLMYRQQDKKTGSYSQWKPAYFMLKCHLLFCFEEKGKREPIFYTQLCVPHCNGCFRLHWSDRPHCFEVILANSASIQLAASNAMDSSEWQQAILEAVCQAGHFLDVDEVCCTTCALLIANGQLFTVVSDAKSGNITIHGRASISELLAVYTDAEANLCCLLEFESGEVTKCSGEWIIHFESEKEKDKFVEIVSTFWEDIFQVPLSISSIKDLYLLQKCRDGAKQFKNDRDLVVTQCGDS